MTDARNPGTDPRPALVYRISIKGHLGHEWTDWFEDLSTTLEADGETLLTGPVVDHAALHGLLKKGRELDMPLHSVSIVQPGSADGSALACRPPRPYHGNVEDTHVRTT